MILLFPFNVCFAYHAHTHARTYTHKQIKLLFFWKTRSLVNGAQQVQGQVRCTGSCHEALRWPLALGSLTESDLFSVKLKPNILERSIFQIIITQQLADWLLVICWRATLFYFWLTTFSLPCLWVDVGLSVLEVRRHHLSLVCFLTIISFFPTQVQGHTV